MEIKTIEIEKPEDMNFILGQSHFIKTVEDIYEAIVNSVPQAKFGLAFCEASGDCKIRSTGNKETLQKIAEKNALKIGAGHSFIIFMENCFPLHILKNIQKVPEVCNIFCATANPTKVIICEEENNNKKARGIIGVIDGYTADAVEDETQKKWRHKFLRDIGYKH